MYQSVTSTTLSQSEIKKIQSKKRSGNNYQVICNAMLPDLEQLAEEGWIMCGVSSEVGQYSDGSIYIDNFFWLKKG